MKRTMRLSLAMVAMAGTASGVAARPDFPEVEPNETKAQATAVTLAAGDAVTGNTTGTSTTTPGAASADTFLVQTATLPLGIYRNRLVLTTTGTAGHTGTIRGLNQTATGIGTTDTTVQTSSTTTVPARFNQWYGFGKGEKVYYRVTGSATTVDDYRATLEVAPVTPTDLGTFQAGEIVITTVGQGHTTDTDLWVYDSTYTAIAGGGNDDESIAGGGTGTTLQSRLTRTYTAGVYYLALTSFNFANNLQSPPDDDFRLGAVLDFADAATNSSTTTNQNVAFAMTDGLGTTPFTATKPGAFDIVWARFTVSGTVTTGACCFTDGSCQVLTPAQCSSQGGTYAGDNVTCAAANCPQPPTGACCLLSNTCQVLTAAQCAAQGGVYRGNNTSCATANCPTVYVGTNLGIAIADGGVPSNGGPGADAVATLNVPSAGTITDIDIDFMITHTWQGDLGVKLMGPGGQTVDLVTRPGVAPPKFTPGTTAGFGFTNDNYGNATSNTPFLADDQAPLNGIYDNGTGAPGVGTATAANDVNGRWKPVQPLSVFNGTSQQGDWKLIVNDYAAGDTGTIQQFSLHITTGGAPAGCYANCDNSTSAPCLNVNDFVCFNTQYAAGSSYANCDASTLSPILNVNDFVCFNTKFAAGCTNPCDPHP